MNTCEQHDDCIVVYDTTYGKPCPICEAFTDKDNTIQEKDEKIQELTDRIEELEDAIVALEEQLNQK